MAMNRAERQQAIVTRVDAVGTSSYQELSRLFGVSEMTIRRDVDSLVIQGELIKSVGSVQTAHASKHLYESAVQQRLRTHRQEKEQIAREALQRITSQQTLFLDGGTTCLVLARQLARHARDITTVTHSALVCLELGRSSHNSIVGLGGQFEPGSACFVGPVAEQAARQLFVDVAFFSTKGFLPEEGTFESSMATFRIKQIIAEQATHVVLLVDHSKFGQRALCKVLDVAQVDEVITDCQTQAGDITNLRNQGVTVRVAPALAGTSAAD
jgi:DeoR/GlpR family transcriptional regulator of sugar metabolism